MPKHPRTRTQPNRFNPCGAASPQRRKAGAAAGSAGGSPSAAGGGKGKERLAPATAAEVGAQLEAAQQ
eukprot:3710624-Rhodomonas_salina.1